MSVYLARSERRPAAGRRRRAVQVVVWYRKAAEQGHAPEFPPINIWRGPEGIIVTTEILGVKLDDFDLTVHQNTLTFKGRREPEAKEPKASFHRRERTFGPFTRTIALPYNVDADQTKASVQNGILTVHLPRLVTA